MIGVLIAVAWILLAVVAARAIGGGIGIADEAAAQAHAVPDSPADLGGAA